MKRSMSLCGGSVVSRATGDLASFFFRLPQGPRAHRSFSLHPSLSSSSPPSLFSFPQAFDRHLNMILGDVEETVTTPEIDEETDEEIIRVSVPFPPLLPPSFPPFHLFNPDFG